MTIRGNSKIPSDGEIYSMFGDDKYKKLVDETLKDMFKMEDEQDGFVESTELV